MNREALTKFSRTAFKIRQGFIWFLRFVSVFLLVAVIIMVIWRKLPWKVTTVLALVPALGIFVPRKWVAWVWMLPLVGVMSVYIWIQLPAGAGGSNWQTYQFETKQEVHSADWKITPANNAALRYDQLLTSYDESILGYQFMDEAGRDRTFGQAWAGEQFPQFTVWLTTFEPGLNELLSIADMKACRFDIPRNQTEINAQLKRLNLLKGWTRLLLRSANRDLGEGRFETALKKQLAVVNMAQHLYDQQSLFDQAGAFDLELLASRAMGTTIINHCDDPNTLNTIQMTFAELDSGWAKSWQAIVEREKLFAKNIAALFYEVNANGRTRVSRKAMFALQEGLGFQPRRLFLKQHEMNRLAVIGLRLSLPFTPDGMADLIDKQFDHYSLQIQKGDRPEYIAPQHMWKKGWNCRAPVDWLARFQIKWFWALDGQDRRHDALVSLIDIFTSLKMYHLDHNHWPESLDELALLNPHALIDPVHGKPFVYQKTDTGFRLYSLGPNGTDDDGINNPVEKKDDILFWPRGPMDKAIEEAAQEKE